MLDHDLRLSIDDALLDSVMDIGFDPVYGARPLKRAMQSLIENPLAEAILAGDFPVGSTIKGSVVDGRPKFVKA